MLETVATSVLTALAVAVIAGVWKWGRPLARGLLSRWKLDHQALTTGAWAVHLPPDGSVDQAVRLRVVAAPSRTIRGTQFDVGMAIVFARDLLGVPGVVAFSGPSDGVRIEPEDGRENTNFAWVYPTGKVDIATTIPTTMTNGRRQLEVMPLLRAVTVVFMAMTSTAYPALQGLGAWNRLRRMDWLIGASIECRLPDHQVVGSWDDLIFPSQVPSRVTRDRRPFCPTSGYGSAQLRGTWRRVSTLEVVLSSFLSGFLAENGYYDFDAAVAECVGLQIQEVAVYQGTSGQ